MIARHVGKHADPKAHVVDAAECERVRADLHRRPRVRRRRASMASRPWSSGGSGVVFSSGHDARPNAAPSVPIVPQAARVVEDRRNMWRRGRFAVRAGNADDVEGCDGSRVKRGGQRARARGAYPSTTTTPTSGGRHEPASLRRRPQRAPRATACATNAWPSSRFRAVATNTAPGRTLVNRFVDAGDPPAGHAGDARMRRVSRAIKSPNFAHRSARPAHGWPRGRRCGRTPACSIAARAIFANAGAATTPP